MRPGGLLRADRSSARAFKGAWLSEVRSALLSVVFPTGCRICEQLLTEATRIPICNDCPSSFRAISDTVCDNCGRPIEGADTSDAEAFVCPTCVNDVKFQDIPYILLSGHPLQIGAAQLAVHHGGPQVDEVEFAHQATAVVHQYPLLDAHDLHPFARQRAGYFPHLAV